MDIYKQEGLYSTEDFTVRSDMVKLFGSRTSLELYYYQGPETQEGEMLTPDNGFPSVLFKIEGERWK